MKDSAGQKTIQEMYRKVQEHDREIKRISVGVKDMVSLDRLESVEHRLNYTVSEDYMNTTQAALKGGIMEELRKTIDLIYKLEGQVSLGYVNNGYFSNKMAEIGE